MNDCILSCEEVSKSYHDGTSEIRVLKEVNVSIKAGESVAIIGPSGSGKSTFLHLLGGLDAPSSGHILIQGKDWEKLNERKRCLLRNQNLGFIYQFHHLLPEFSALENVSMPLLLGNMDVAQAKDLAMQILDKVGLSARVSHKPAQLSGGERQRVAIARALVHKPACVLADEPTGNLDQNTAAKVFDLMMGLRTELNTSLVMVTHDPELAKKMDRVLQLSDGDLVENAD